VTDAAPEDPLMEIHKPHAAKTWKEFFIELGTITLGILIALSLEQAVEHWRENRQYAEARQAMIDELSANLTNVRRRQKSIACTEQRMHDIDAILDRAKAGLPFEAPSWIGPAVSVRMRFIAESEAEKSTLFSSAEQRSLGSPYSYFHSIDAEQDRERLAWGRLQMLEGKSRLSPEMIQSLRNALADARYENYRLVFLTEWAEGWGRRLGLKDFPGASIYAMSKHPHCVPMTMPAALAERETALRPNF
jgi:hypothetical protein